MHYSNTFITGDASILQMLLPLFLNSRETNNILLYYSEQALLRAENVSIVVLRFEIKHLKLAGTSVELGDFIKGFRHGVCFILLHCIAIMKNDELLP